MRHIFPETLNVSPDEDLIVQNTHTPPSRLPGWNHQRPNNQFRPWTWPDRAR